MGGESYRPSRPWHSFKRLCSTPIRQPVLLSSTGLTPISLSLSDLSRVDQSDQEQVFDRRPND